MNSCITEDSHQHAEEREHGSMRICDYRTLPTWDQELFLEDTELERRSRRQVRVGGRKEDSILD